MADRCSQWLLDLPQIVPFNQEFPTVQSVQVGHFRPDWTAKTNYLETAAELNGLEAIPLIEA